MWPKTTIQEFAELLEDNFFFNPKQIVLPFIPSPFQNYQDSQGKWINKLLLFFLLMFYVFVIWDLYTNLICRLKLC